MELDSAKEIHKWMIAHKKTLGLAESCTGGRIAAELTALSGASEYFLGSLVTYSDHLKKKLLGVSLETLKKYGAVSKETALSMLQGIFTQTEADYGLSVTGLAGPKKGTLPIGTVFIAAAERKSTPHTEEYCFSGDREEIQRTATRFALKMLYRVIRNRDLS